MSPLSKEGSMSEREHVVPKVLDDCQYKIRGPAEREEGNGPTPVPRPGDE